MEFQTLPTDATAPPATDTAPIASATDLTRIASKASLGVAWVAAQASAGATIRMAQDSALAAVAARQTAAVRPSSLYAQDGAQASTAEIETEYFAARIVGRPARGPAAQFAGATVLEVLAQTRLAGRGVNLDRHASPDRIMSYLSRDDVPLLTRSGLSRALNEMYPTLRSPLLQLAQTRDLPDFRPQTLIRLAQHRPLDRVHENGEVRFAFPTEAGEPISLITYANSFPMSREVMINDDLGGLSAFTMAGAQAAAARERELLAALLTAGAGAGPTMSDNLPWFHSSRNNIGTSAALSATSVAEAVSLLRGLTDNGGQRVYGLEPFAIVVSAAREYLARQLVATLATPATRGDVQPFVLAVVVEPALSGGRWWLTTTPSSRRCLAAGYLRGAQTPTVETFEDANVLGSTVRVTFDVAAAVQDPIGWVTNAGG